MIDPYLKFGEWLVNILKNWSSKYHLKSKTNYIFVHSSNNIRYFESGFLKGFFQRHQMELCNLIMYGIKEEFDI